MPWGQCGGLLMGAVVNMAPDLYEGVVSAVPFVDGNHNVRPINSSDYWGI